jgi:pimeloyl-ACP methyl ester carboxylesterase
VFSENGIKPTGSPLRGFVVTSLNDLKRGSNSTLTILGTGQAQVTFTNPKHPEMSRTMLYSLSGSQWILTRVTTSFNNGTRTTSTVADISVTGWNKNTSADARRAGKHDEKIKQSPLMQSNTATFSSGESLKTLASPALGEGYLVGSANSGTGEANIQSTAMAATPMTLSGPGVGINVVYVHGFNSSGQTWSKMQPWLQSDFNFNQSLMPSIGNGGRDELADWTSQLNSYLPSVSPLGPSYLAIGHSAGGLVSRGEADYNSHTVGGVITIDTPHQGDMLLDNGVAGLDKLAVYGMNWVVGDMCSADAATCATLANLLGIAAVGGIEVGIGVETPALIDLQYKSLYTQGLNLVPETYPSAGIVGVSDPRWLEFRLGGDLADGPTGTYGGQNLATTADATYWTIDGLSWLFWGIAEDYYDDDDYDDGDYYMWLSDLCTDAENGMDWLDSNFNHYVTTDYYTGDSDPIGSDGIVQATSQYYPNSLSTNIVIPDADSHMGATQSQLVRAALDTLLSNQFFVAPPVHLTCCRPIIPPGGPQN